MDADTAIEVSSLGKKYFIGEKERYLTLRDSLINAAKTPLLWLSNRDGSEKKHIWALQDISFTVKKGEIVGIIGRNGSGKTTLLKILSRITEPTLGEVKMRGRVSSLLEVGTGFHSELTGRENIYLNGTILGMRREEINRKFDELVEFSGVEKFLDTPVKRYSSGMRVRLAFSVAAYLEPEILLIDEVLAVGDAEFQKKCLGKMKDVTQKGITVIFVSHNMTAIQNLCTRCVWLDKGAVKLVASTDEVVNRYLAEMSKKIQILLSKRDDRKGKGKITYQDLKIRSKNTDALIKRGEDILVTMTVSNSYDYEVKVRPSLAICTTRETELISCDAKLIGQTFCLPPLQKTVIECQINAAPLNIGVYLVNIALYQGDETEDWISSAAQFEVHPGKYEDHLNVNHFPILTKFSWKKKNG